MALDCFFAVWFVVGNVWIFGGHSSAADAPNLYRYFAMVYISFTRSKFCPFFKARVIFFLNLCCFAGYV